MITLQHRAFKVVCPNCSLKDLGRVGIGQYFCWNCCIEFRTDNGQLISVYQVEEDGRLHSLNDLFIDTDSSQTIA